MLPYQVTSQLYQLEPHSIEQVMRLKLLLPFLGGICLHVRANMCVLEIESKNVKDMGRRW